MNDSNIMDNNSKFINIVLFILNNINIYIKQTIMVFIFNFFLCFLLISGLLCVSAGAYNIKLINDRIDISIFCIRLNSIKVNTNGNTIKIKLLDI